MAPLRSFRGCGAAVALLFALAIGIARGGATSVAAARQDGTPTPPISCDTATPVAATPTVAHDMAGTPMAGTAMEFDQSYIDMMIPHHASIVALAQVALPRLQDERLVAIAETIVATQTAEIAELRGYRERFYGSAEPMPMDAAAMMQMMPNLTMPMDAMMAQMDAATQVATFCAAGDAELAFIDLTIPHHQSAIAASEAALQQATHDEVRAFAERVIADQRREIDELSAIRQELYGSATPEAVATIGHVGDAAEPAIAGGVEIRTLTAEQIAQIERGEGAGFALPAERNGVPGPRHVLDLAAELGLSAEQRDEIERIFDAMKADAIAAGTRYLAAQRSLEQDFRDGTLTEAALPGRVADVSRHEGGLAAIHLVAHLRTAAILTPDQIAAYQELRAAA